MCVLVCLFDGVVVSGGLCSLLCRLCLGCCGALEFAEGGWVCLVFEGGSPASRPGFRLDKELEGLVGEVFQVAWVPQEGAGNALSLVHQS